MISEKELAKLSWATAPKIVCGTFPGPKTQEYLQSSFDNESMARGGGRSPFVFAEGKGATVKDPDGNVMIDITAGVRGKLGGSLSPEGDQSHAGPDEISHACQ
jgi:4-aminobutyrate aminotransferase